MRFAFFIIAHAAPRQLAWLAEALTDPQDLILVHINARTDDETAAALQSAFRRDDVIFLPRRPINWGGWSLAAVDLEAMRAALRAPAHWDYFVNLSGQDYPIQPLDRMRQELSAAPPTTHMEVRRIRDLAFHFRLRSLLTHTETPHGPRRRLWPNLAPRPAPTLYHGLKWGLFPRGFCEWLLSDDDRLRKAERFFARTKIPDESLIQSLFMASPFRDAHSQDHKRFVDFDGGRANPRTLTLGDWDALAASSAYFARKFDEAREPELMRRAARRIGAGRPKD